MVELRLLDTDTVSYYFRHDAVVQTHVRRYLNEHDALTISCITYYEVLRGLLARNSTRQLRDFDRFISHNHVVPLDKQALGAAAEIYAQLQKQGTLINEGDMLIAGTAVALNAVLVTNNTAHFSRIPQLKIENWRLP